MKQKPDSFLIPHINHYWIEEQGSEIFGREHLYAYPGLTPELLLVLEGSIEYIYQGAVAKVKEGCFFTFIHEKLIFDSTNLKSFILIQFQSRGVSSALPFVNFTADELIKNPLLDISLLGSNTEKLMNELRNTKGEESKQVVLLDEFFTSVFQSDKVGVLPKITSSLKSMMTLKEIIKNTAYSESTFQRHFKKETGLTPKLFLSLQRYKRVVQEIIDSKNDDWMHYVVKYNYFDQSHFIKEVKKFTSFTPSELLKKPSILGVRKLEID